MLGAGPPTRVIAVLDVQVLGPLQVRRDGAPVAVAGRLRQALVARLVLAGGAIVPQARLVAALWGEGAPPSARNGLQVLVAQLRRRCGSELIRSSASGYGLGPDVDTDLIRLDAHERQGDERVALHDDIAGAAAYSLALRQWRGPLLAGVDLDEIEGERDALEERRLRLLQALGAAQVRLGAWAAAIENLTPVVDELPLREELVAVLAAALTGAGRRAEALERIRATRSRLKEEYGVGAGPALERALRQTLHDQPRPPAPRPRRGIPHVRAAIIGRERELEDVERLLAHARLVTVTGPAGVGKTRLAEAVVERDPSTAAFVSLLGAADAEDLLPTVATALGLQAPGSSPMTAVVAGVSDAKDLRLLVLDNLEHLPGAAAVVEQLLVAVPRVAVLATSRQSLQLAAEHRYRLAPLDVDRGTESTSGRLLLQRARRADPAFAVEPDESAELGRVLRACDGLPLALELAASWLDVLSLPELADRVDDRVSALVSPHAEAAARHTSMRAAIDWSVDRLDARAGAALAAAAVFAGGFTLPMLSRIVGTEPAEVAMDLAQLRDRSLVERDAGRFELLHVIRQRVLERTPAGELTALRHAHLRLVHERIAEVPRSRAWPSTSEDMALLQAEQANVRTAVRFSAEQDLQRHIDLLVTGSTGWVLLGGEQELVAWCEAVLARPDLDAAQRFDGMLALERAVGLHGGARSRRLLDDAAALRNSVDRDRRLALDVRLSWGSMFDGDVDGARSGIAALRRELRADDEPELALLNDELEIVLQLADDPDAAVGRFEQLLARARRAGLELQARAIGQNLTEALLWVGRAADAEDLCLRLLADTEPRATGLRGQLLVQLGTALTVRGRSDRAAAVFQMAVPLLHGSTFDAERLMIVLALAAGRPGPIGDEDRSYLLDGWWTAVGLRGTPPNPIERALLADLGPRPVAPTAAGPGLSTVVAALMDRVARLPASVEAS